MNVLTQKHIIMKPVAALLCAVLFLPIMVLAYFADGENSPANQFAAGTLDIAISIIPDTYTLASTPGDEVSHTIVIGPGDSVPASYVVSTEIDPGSDVAFCNALEMSVDFDTYTFTGAITGYTSPDMNDFGAWTFAHVLATGTSGYVDGDECTLTYHFDAVPDGMPWATGFYDRESTNITISFTDNNADMVVLNEFLPNPEGIAYGVDFGSDSSSMPRGEWVELYNNGDEPVDLSGWYIWDASGFAANQIAVTDSNTIPATTTIGAHSWLVVYMNKSVLNNSADTVTLYDGSDTIIDTYSYDGNDQCELEPTPNATNTASGGNGSCAIIPPNKSYARIPDGTGPFIDPIPTPGDVNVLEFVVANSSGGGGGNGDSQLIETEPEVEVVVTEPIVQTTNTEPVGVPILIATSSSSSTVEVIEESSSSTERVTLAPEDPAPETASNTQTIEIIIPDELIFDADEVEPEDPVEPEEPIEEEEVIEVEEIEAEPEIEGPEPEETPESVEIEEPAEAVLPEISEETNEMIV